jgi:hypothetical protein
MVHYQGRKSIASLVLCKECPIYVHIFINQLHIELGPSLGTVPFHLIQFHTLLLNMHEPSRVRQVQNMKLLHYEACWTSSITFKELGKLCDVIKNFFENHNSFLMHRIIYE